MNRRINIFVFVLLLLLGVFNIWRLAGVGSYVLAVSSPISSPLSPTPTPVSSPVDYIPPTVAITNPKNNSFVSSGNYLISANASDNVGVSRVTFYIDGQIMADDYSAPYATSWNTKNLVNGSIHTIAVTAYDTSGNAAKAEPVYVTVDKIAPAVAMVTPTDGSLVPQGSRVFLGATASDSISLINRVVFQVNGKHVCTAYFAPYACNVTVPQGAGIAYTVTAWAIDNANNKNSSSVKVTSY